MLLGYWTKTTIFSFFWYHHSPGSHQKSQCLRSLTDWLTHSLTVTTSRASCDAKNKPCLQSSSLPFFSRSRGLVNRVCLAPVSLLSDCFLTRGSCTYTRQRCVQRTLAGRVWLVQALNCLPPSPLHESQTLPRSLKPEVSPAFEGRVLFQQLLALCDLKKLSSVVVRWWCNASNHDQSRVVAKPARIEKVPLATRLRSKKWGQSDWPVESCNCCHAMFGVCEIFLLKVLPIFFSQWIASWDVQKFAHLHMGFKYGQHRLFQCFCNMVEHVCLLRKKILMHLCFRLFSSDI